jgi:hypothetical protein
MARRGVRGKSPSESEYNREGWVPLNESYRTTALTGAAAEHFGLHFKFDKDGHGNRLFLVEDQGNIDLLSIFCS